MSGGDASLVLVLTEPLLRELAPASLLNKRGELGFRLQSLGIDPRAQALVALLRQRLQNGNMESLEAESSLLTLVRRSLGPRTSRERGSTQGKRLLVDRVKLLLAGDLGRRWTLTDIATEIGGSAAYLTQAFQQVERLPLYRYQLNLRLARALDLVANYEDLSTLALDLGFSSHSHFSAAFKQAYGRSPSAFRHALS
jgi:AraC family transcriptional regulator